MVHWHMRYGNTCFDDLINNTNYAMWYPTFAVEGTTMEKVADGYAEGAEMMGAMMLASQGSIVPAERIYGLARHMEAAVTALHDASLVVEVAMDEPEKNKEGIQKAVGSILGFASGLEQRRVELHDLTEGLEGEHVEAIHKESEKFKEPVDKLFTYANQLDGFKEEPAKNAEKIHELAGKIHIHVHQGLEGPSRKIVRRSKALGYEAPESGKEIVWEYTTEKNAYCVQRLENGNTLIVSGGDNWSTIEVTQDNEIVWEYPAVAFNARRLPNGNTLIAEMKKKGKPGHVTEASQDKEIIWQYSGDFSPYNAVRLPNRNTVFSDDKNSRIVEVTPEKEIVWEYTDLIRVGCVQVLPNGNILTVETRDTENYTDTRLIEITRDKEIIWEFSGFDAMFGSVQRLPNGNTVITDSDRTKKENPRIIEVAPDGEIVWEYTDFDLVYPWGVHRLPNGNTLIADGRTPRVIELGTP
jgi:hypothetical protein